jgi:hypothetical protein
LTAGVDECDVHAYSEHHTNNINGGIISVVYAGTDIALHFPKVKKLPNTIVTTGSPSSKLLVSGSRAKWKTEPGASHARQAARGPTEWILDTPLHLESLVF